MIYEAATSIVCIEDHDGKESVNEINDENVYIL